MPDTESPHTVSAAHRLSNENQRAAGGGALVKVANSYFMKTQNDFIDFKNVKSLLTVFGFI
jgi:hypothetical protein